MLQTSASAEVERAAAAAEGVRLFETDVLVL